MQATKTLEKNAGTSEDILCPLAKIADQIDASGGQRKMLAQRHPCYEIKYIGVESDKEGKTKLITRKSCDGYDTSCPGHPNYMAD